MNFEQSYSKPENHDEMVENMKILRELPEDISDPKVVIKLGNPEIAHKYVTMKDEDGREYVIAMPIENKKFHHEIVALAEKLYQKKFSDISGGYINIDGDRLIVRGASEGYGRGDNKHVVEILQKKFPELKVEAKAISLYEVVGDKELPKEVEKMVTQLNETTIFVDKLRDRLGEIRGEFERGEITKEELTANFSRYESVIQMKEQTIPTIQKILRDVGVEITTVE